jgi:hypothetical protein
MLDSNKIYICITKCPELDDDNSKHCAGTGDYIKRRESIGRDFCPCGNIAKWEEYKEESQ